MIVDEAEGKLSTHVSRILTEINANYNFHALFNFMLQQSCTKRIAIENLQLCLPTLACSIFSSFFKSTHSDLLNFWSSQEYNYPFPSKCDSKNS